MATKSQPERHRLTLMLAAFLFLNTFVLNSLLILAFGTWWKETVFFDAFRFLQKTAQPVSEETIDENADSWDPMISALRYENSRQATPLYTAVFFNAKIKFQYPPTALLPLRFLQSIVNDAALPQVLSWITWLSFLVFVVFLCLILRSLHLECAERPGDEPIRMALLVVAELTFYPAIKSHSLGQIQTWINTAFTAAVWFWLRRSERRAGALFAFAALIKPQFLVVLVWALLRKKAGFAIAFVAVFLAGTGISIFLFGLSDHLNYLSVLTFIARHGESYYHNQSVNGLLNRLLGNGEIIYWHPNDFPPFHPAVYLGTVVSSGLLLIAGLWPRRGSGGVFDLCSIALASVMASPVAWQHHYGILLPIYIVLLAGFARHHITDKRWLAVLGFSYILTSNFYAITKKLAYAPAPINIAQSYLFFGALIVLFLLFLLQTKSVENRQEIIAPIP